ncbi:NAD-dependent deacylase [Phaeodactylibacter sp.]|jgi:NAD-dependent deacetylase|uniref:SIR2 family NAD-dependent protein deacylase n=1 Tax=Phaeodactylibacter sp. TaxID=1940289 RepID=UPI0025E10F2F|nr:NAD-dependent deacylase [Phaeodactylibacter sp.]MCI4650674.1 NAD-dependent deacylase [Phaeodactylibacter sp.]MCI5092387.1 NAD-dependent deacylase [Phaeodactylibacter sp.]
MDKLVILTGAGMSAESGIKTFRDDDGLWEGHDVMEVASPQGWRNNPELVLDFYNQRRRQLHEVRPNSGHEALSALEDIFNTTVVTQNVDDLHERGGSSNVLHLHGELFKVRSTKHPELVYDWKEDLNIGDTCEKGHQLRPHIVWFGEAVPMLEEAALEVLDADIIMIIGSSMQVYPAAGLVGFAQKARKIYYVDPNPSINYELSLIADLKVIDAPATQGVPAVVEDLMKV